MDRVRRAIHPPPARPRRILLLDLWSKIGDTIVQTPLFLACREAFPDAHLALLTTPVGEALLRNTPVLDELIVMDRFPWPIWDGKYNPLKYRWREHFRLLRRIREGEFDTVISPTVDLRINIFMFLTGIARRIAYGHNGGRFFLTHAVSLDPGGVHHAEDGLNILRDLGLPFTPVTPRLWIDASERARAREALERLGWRPGRRLVGIHPGAGHRFRFWPIERFEAVLAHLVREYDAFPVVFLDPGAGSPVLHIDPPPCEVRTDIRSMAAMISVLDLFIGNDSGPAHIAAVSGVRTLTVFSCGNHHWWRPLGPRVRILTPEGLPCAPCATRRDCPDPVCIDWVKTEDAIRASVRLMEEFE